MPTGTSATPSKPVDETPPIVEPKAAKVQAPIVPSEILMIFDPTQDPTISTTSLVFMPIAEAALADGKTQKIPEKVEIQPGLNKISPELWEIISSSPLPHIKGAIDRQAIRIMDPWDTAILRERREIVAQCNNADLLPMMEIWLTGEESPIVKADLEKRILDLRADRPDLYQPLRGMMANAA